MDAAELQDWIIAGKIAGEVREWSKSLIKSGARLLDIAEAIETQIRQKGAVLGFPVNLSLNTTAAHYTPIPNDTITLTDEVIKVDIGVSYNGAIGDTAYTVDLSGKHSDLVAASHAALEAVIPHLKPGVALGEIGSIIEQTIVARGFQPVRNLSGHGLARYEIHTAPSIPNYNTHEKIVLNKGQIIAIEPFATTGIGRIKDVPPAFIYEEVLDKPIRDQFARKVLQKIKLFSGLPFCARDLTDDLFSYARVLLALRVLTQQGNLVAHPPLVEVSGGIVSQAEHTFYIDDKTIVLTK